MKQGKKTVIFSNKVDPKTGEPIPIKLTPHEEAQATYWQNEIKARFGNALGYEVSITTLTQVVKKVSEQKFYQIPFAQYLPVRVGEGQFMSNLETFRSFDVSDVFESGIINTGAGSGRQSVAETAIDALNIKINNWAKHIPYTIFELEMASRSGNWDLIAAKEQTRKRNWDLGLQRVSFLGANGQNGSGGSCLGLLNQAGVTIDTTLITAALSGLSTSGLSTFQQKAIQAYRANCNYTVYPTHFIIPESDYNGMAAQASAQFPMKNILQLLEEGFQLITQNKNFKILPLVYCQTAQALAMGVSLNSAFATGQYIFLNYDEASLRMDVPLPYTNTLANSLDNFQFQNAGYGQFTGVLAYRPAELYYAGY